jgi:hypothetical protein
MPHDLLAAPFLGQHLLLRPGSASGVQLPRGHFDQLAQAAATDRAYPSWLPALAFNTWQVQLPDDAAVGRGVLVREASRWGTGGQAGKSTWAAITPARTAPERHWWLVASAGASVLEAICPLDA